MTAESRSAGGVCGGDFYAFAPRAPTRLAVVIGDACGRGPDGARLLPLVLPNVEKLLRTGESPGQLLEALNRTLVGVLPGDRFVTAAALELDTEKGTFVIASAGHVPVLLKGARQGVFSVGLASGPPLGIQRDCRYAEERHGVAVGDVAVLMTDGLLEALESDLLAMVTMRALFESAPEGGSAVQEHFLSELEPFSARRLADDMLLVCLEIVGSPRDGTRETALEGA
jgi:serine phosphatase RsbU (regulator of sigma subunit)